MDTGLMNLGKITGLSGEVAGIVFRHIISNAVVYVLYRKWRVSEVL
jgi:hypothetical protein